MYSYDTRRFTRDIMTYDGGLMCVYILKNVIISCTSTALQLSRRVCAEIEINHDYTFYLVVQMYRWGFGGGLVPASASKSSRQARQTKPASDRSH